MRPSITILFIVSVRQQEAGADGQFMSARAERRRSVSLVEKVVCRSPRREGGYQSKWNTIWGAVPRGVGLAGIAAADKLPPNPEVHIRR